MTGKDIVRQFEAAHPEIQQAVQEVLRPEREQELKSLYEESTKAFEPGSILEGTIVSIGKDEVVVDVGYKSEGTVDIREFENPEELKVGQKVEVLLETVEDDAGVVVLSKRRADRIRGWEKIVSEKKEDDVVSGRVTRKIKGGLLVDIGVPVFLPASQVSIRRSGDIAEYIGQEIEAKIIKIDRDRRNIVISRRRMLEEQREEQKKRLLEEIQVGEIRRGVVKNITDFGAFVDLGGIDGLLHITDMSWGRISQPSELVAIDDVIEVMVLNVDKEKEKISLGLKQKTPSPWDGIEERYPVGSRVKGTVVNVMSYGAFVKLEEGVEGLVHISEMSWTRRINHPSEVVAIGDTVEVVVLGINLEKQEISLGMKQTEVNPWTLVTDKYPPGTIVRGRVRNLTNYGAFVEIEEGIDGLLHVSDISWTKKITHPSEVLKKGDKVEAMVISVDTEKKRIALGMKQLEEDPWQDKIPAKYKSGDVIKGKVTKLTNFGAFVELEDGLEGLLHVSEMSDRKVNSPEELVKLGDELEVRVLRVDPKERRIGLSMRQATEPQETTEPYDEEATAAGGVVEADVEEAAETEVETPGEAQPEPSPEESAEEKSQHTTAEESTEEQSVAKTAPAEDEKETQPAQSEEPQTKEEQEKQSDGSSPEQAGSG